MGHINHISFYSIPPFILSILVLSVGILVLSHNRKAISHQTFFMECVSVFLWLFGYAMMYSTTDREFASECAKFVYTGVVFIHTFFYHFTISFLKVQNQRKRMIVTAYVLSFVLLVLLYHPNSFISGVYDYYWGYQTRVNSRHNIFIPLFVVYYALSYKELLYIFHKTPKGTQEYNRLKYVMTAYFVALFATIDLLPNYGFELYPCGFIFIVAWISLIAYTIVKHQLMDINVVIKKTIAYSLVLLLLIVPCFAAVILTEKYLPESFFYPVLAALFILVGFVFPRMKVQAERNLETILFRGMFDYKETLDNLSRELATLQDLDELLSNTTKRIARAMDTNRLGLYLLTDEGDYKLKASYGPYRQDDARADEVRSLVSGLQRTDEVVRADRKDKHDGSMDSQIKEELSALGARICIPIKFKRELKGFMVLGEKESAGDYSREELKVLSTMANSLAVAIENSLKYEELKELSVNLENIVEKRTRELQRANDELRELDRLKSEFFSRVSHELRTPLTNIILPVENVLAAAGDRLDPANREEKLTILRNARKLTKRINEILDLSKLEAGKMKIRTAPSDINGILNEIVEASALAAREMGIDLELEPDMHLSRPYVDAEKMEKVFSNLISNALKFTQSGGRIRITTRETAQHVEVTVSDTGIGIPEKELPHIFSRFHQVDGSSSRKYEGTGLGLTLVKELVELHQGTVTVTSELGKGTTFTVRLLKGKDHLAEEEIIEEPDRIIRNNLEYCENDDPSHDVWRGTRPEDRETIDSLQIQLSDLAQGAEYDEKKAQENYGNAEKKSVLVVDDNRDLAGNIANCLAQLYHVTVAYNGRQGLEAVHRIMPDLVISDLMMPEMDGNELCLKIKGDQRTRHIPIILLTAKAGVADRIKGLKHGADQYLAKPFNVGELKAVVGSLLTTRALQTQLNLRNQELTQTLHELEETQVQLVHAARLESTGQLAAGVAHEIKNHIYCLRAGLAGIKKRLALASAGKLDIQETYDQLLQALRTSDDAIEGALLIVNSLLDFSRKNREGMMLSDIHQGIDATLMMVSPMITEAVTIRKEYGEIDKVECRIEEINQVVMNMILNASQVMEGEGVIRIKTDQDENQVRIRIEDSGPGILPDHLGKIFTPFFSTKEKQNGHGLGLSICHRIVRNHHGTIDVKSAAGEGTVFTIVLPTRQPRTECDLQSASWTPTERAAT